MKLTPREVGRDVPGRRPFATVSGGRRKNQKEANLKKEMKGSYQMKKMKKACAVLLAVLSVSLLASAFAGEDNNNKVETVTPVASDRPVDLDVGDLARVAALG